MLFALLIGGMVNPQFLFIASWLNVLVLPYVFYSISYQWRVVKQWCPTCLTVQVALVLQFITALIGRFHSKINLSELKLLNTFPFLVSFVLVFLALILLIPALEKAKESRQDKISLQRLKHDPLIFDALLAKQKKITTSTDGLGITLGSPEAEYKLIKVCNPYCGPCAMAHPVIDELMENNPDLQLQIIFTTCENDMKTPPVKHLLAIAEKGNSKLVKQALDHWYLAEKKDYEVFALKYPMNGELKLQTEKIISMYKWCEKEEIQFTQTYQLFISATFKI